MKRHRVILAAAASQDILSIIEYIAQTGGLEAARAVDELIDGAMSSLDRMPDRARVVPELSARGITAYREALAGPYRIVFRVVRQEVWIVAIVDGRRDLAELLLERARREE